MSLASSPPLERLFGVRCCCTHPMVAVLACCTRLLYSLAVLACCTRLLYSLAVLAGSMLAVLTCLAPPTLAGKYAQVTNNPERDGCINAVLLV